jgi:ubiquinol-cytochrome c reductase cytochrome b subunit
MDRIPFHPYFTLKDIFGVLVFLALFAYFVFFNPNILGHPDNYTEANPMVTPPHIVPEWYFLPFYAILRSIPDKLGGVIGMVAAILILAILPIVNTSQIQSSAFRPIHKKFYWLLLVDCLLLGWVGANAPEPPYIYVGLIGTVYYFLYFIVIVPLIGIIENSLLKTRTV